MFMPALDGSGTFTYTIEATAICSSSSASVTTVIYEGNQAGESGIHTISSTDPPIERPPLPTNGKCPHAEFIPLQAM